MFHIKICGVRQPVDVPAIKNCGGEAIGLNFFRPSVRFLDPDSPQTLELSRAARAAGLMRIGVFVNETPEAIAMVADKVGLDAIQLHGDETIEMAQEVAAQTGLKVIRAIKLQTGEMSPEAISAKVAPWIAAGCHLLLDADAGGAHGGSGQTLDWPSIGAWADQNGAVSWTLAGGLTPENVGDAIEETGVQSVDVSSGVEETRGIKSEWLIRRFVVEGRAAMGI